MLKKLCAFLSLIIIISGFKIQKPLFSSGKGIYTVVTNGFSDGVITSFSTDDMYRFYEFKNISGQSLSTFDKQYIVNFLITYKAQFLFSEACDDMVINYYYTTKISVYRSINGKKVNISVAKNKDYFTIGTPIIYGGF